MIESIFWPNNPVHDGAAIVSENRVVEVGVILPLSNRTDFPNAYGTRHRAAAGLAETTDALVIVVSEERGTITIARGFNVVNMNGRNQLVNAINEHLGVREDQSQFLKRRKLN
jgi:diadenylate cyclase